MAYKFLFNDAQAVRAQINGLLAKHPEMAEDVELLADMIEGETDLLKILDKAVSARQEAVTLAEAIKGRETELSERRKRMERQADVIKQTIQTLMEVAGQEKITLPEATLSITKARTSVNVTDVEALPQGFFKTERKALSKEIKTALEAGERIPGAELVMGDCGLMIRTK
jgi:hypothetical protein